jgi:hypothetical protein
MSCDGKDARSDATRKHFDFGCQFNRFPAFRSRNWWRNGHQLRWSRRNPCLDGLGPVGGRGHGSDEFILVDSVVPRITLLAMLIMQFGDEERFTYANRTG